MNLLMKLTAQETVSVAVPTKLLLPETKKRNSEIELSTTLTLFIP